MKLNIFLKWILCFGSLLTNCSFISLQPAQETIGWANNVSNGFDRLAVPGYYICDSGDSNIGLKITERGKDWLSGAFWVCPDRFYNFADARFGFYDLDDFSLQKADADFWIYHTRVFCIGPTTMKSCEAEFGIDSANNANLVERFAANSNSSFDNSISVEICEKLLSSNPVFKVKSISFPKRFCIKTNKGKTAALAFDQGFLDNDFKFLAKFIVWNP